MTRRLVHILAACIAVLFGCQSSTQPGGDHPSARTLTFATDSLVFYRTPRIAPVWVQVHNGTDSTETFPACCDVSVRVDTLIGTTWIYGTPAWEGPCLAYCTMVLTLARDSTYGTRELIETPGTFRLATIHGREYGVFSDTLYSNTFEVR